MEMIKFFWKQNRKKCIVFLSGLIAFFCFLLLVIMTHRMGKGVADQSAADRWNSDGGVSQVSVFFSVNASVTEDSIEEFEHGIDSALADAGVVQESENPSARLWVDAYSANGKIDVKSDRGSVSADAIGIGGDFFLFHPVKLLYGSYFSGNDLMQDYCIIDEDAAWQLFGSNNVAGMTVTIGGIPHIIMGVVEREEGRLVEAGGLDNTLIYVSLSTLKNYGTCNGINAYEIVMPNPVSEYAYQYVKEKLGGDEAETEVVENSTRFSFVNRLKSITDFGTRAMNGKAILYPYWENVARGLAEILSWLTLLEMLILVYAIISELVLFILWWRHKGWSIHEKRLVLQDRAERLIEKWRAERKRKKAIPDIEVEDLE